jgi:hypothetical protein
MSDRQVIRQTRQEIAPFFGSHGGAELFTKLFIENAPGYSRSINEGDPASIANFQHSFNLMKAEDYNRKEPGMSNNDVHWDFTDFIINSALFLRSIDQPTGRGAVNPEELRTTINQQFTNPTNCQGDQGFCKVSPGETIFGVDNPRTLFSQAKANLNLDQSANNNSNIKKLLTLMVGLLLQNGNGSNNVPVTAFPDVLQRAINAVVTGDNYNNGIVSYLVQNPEINRKFDQYMGRLQPGETSAAFKANLRSAFTGALSSKLVQEVTGLLSRIQGKNGITAARDLITDATTDQLARSLEDAIIDAVNGVYSRNVAASPNMGGSNLSNLVNSVYGKWSNLSDESRNFYKRFFSLMRYNTSTNQWEAVPESEYGRPMDQRSSQNYRVNLTKGTLFQEAPAFVNLIPKFSKKQNLFNDIWYTNSQGRHVKISTAGWQEDDSNPTGAQNFFKNLFVAVYVNRDTVPVLGAQPNNQVAVDYPKTWDTSKMSAMMFDINVDQFVRKRLFKIQQELKQPPIVKGPVISLTDKNIWKVDEQGRLYLDDPSGRVYYGENDPGSMKVLKTNFKCFSTYAKTEGDDCVKYINQCLLRNDTESLKVCAEMWKQKDFYTVAKEEIKNMHPLVAVRTLQKFGFRVHKVEDPELKMLIKKFETVDHWVKHVLTKTWGQQTVQTGTTTESLQSIIENNENILNYLRLLVEYVNSNPQIMNGKEYAGKTAEAVGRLERSELAIKLSIPMIKEPRGPMSTFYDYSMLKSHLESGFLSQTLRRKPTTTFFNPYGSSSVTNNSLSPLGGPVFRSPFSESTYGFGIPFQLGGVYPDINTYFRRKDQGIVSGPEALGSLITVTINDLKNMGKTIDDDDITGIKKKVDNMVTLERELVKTEMYLEEYKYLTELFRNYKSEILTLDTIKGLVEKQKDLLSKQTNEENTLVKILGSLHELKQGKCEDFINDDCEYEQATINLTQLPPPKQPDCVPKQKIC